LDRRPASLTQAREKGENVGRPLVTIVIKLSTSVAPAVAE
jgi:hypothetical protein